MSSLPNCNMYTIFFLTPAPPMPSIYFGLLDMKNPTTLQNKETGTPG